MKIATKFQNVISFGIAFLFHQIHSSNIQQKQNPQQQISKMNQNKLGLSINAMNNMQQKLSTNSSLSSSPKENKAINRMYQMTLKNITIYFVNIIDYKDLYTKSNSNSQFSQFINQSIQGQTN